MAEIKHTLKERTKEQKVNACRTESNSDAMREELKYVSSLAFILLKDPFGFIRVNVKADLQAAEAKEKACFAEAEKKPK